MNPDKDFTTGHRYKGGDGGFSYVILGRSDESVVYLIPEKRNVGISTYAFIKPVHNQWEHSHDCSCHRSHE